MDNYFRFFLYNYLINVSCSVRGQCYFYGDIDSNTSMTQKNKLNKLYTFD